MRQSTNNLTKIVGDFKQAIEYHNKDRSIAIELGSKTLPLWNLYFHSPSVNTTSIVIQG